ncbi:hypothetical protein C5E45_17350 [Nocardia nova]|uniref:Nucleotidyltransferase n=1 Tax=Nocardia nova TaxID=37330 RepID=A0A2S6AP32_9NOCA|nr:hypothetical protein [Nocardia nova]PPJ28893.1 hypothetical protein C5E41_12615 [Nocardia nova]PPJ36988.1 hypothetical protein C5E45_17350 [Nocardia nova]
MDLIDSVVVELVSRAEADTESIMLIGAHCRDLLHKGFGHTEPLRSTNDVDVAIAVDGEVEYRQIVEALSKSGSTDIRYLIAGIAVDVVPFGEIENPAGTTSLPDRRESFDVFGFQEVFAKSIRLPLPSGSRIALPAPAGYAALKMKAWCDRSPNGEYKDASDIATICTWYQEDADIRSSLYGRRTDLLIEADLDVSIASLHLLGEDISAILGDTRVAELATVWDRHRP